MGNYRFCGDGDRYKLGISTLPRGSDLFICIGHGGYGERAAMFTKVPEGSQVYFYNGHDTSLESGQIADLLANPLGAVIPPVKSIAGGSANIWNYRVQPFNLQKKSEANLSKLYEAAWTDMDSIPNHPANDVLVMNIYSDVYKTQSSELVFLSDILNLLPGYARYHWCACRSITDTAWDSFRSYSPRSGLPGL